MGMPSYYGRHAHSVGYEVHGHAERSEPNPGVPAEIREVGRYTSLRRPADCPTQRGATRSPGQLQKGSLANLVKRSPGELTALAKARLRRMQYWRGCSRRSWHAPGSTSRPSITPEIEER
jgi:hypothetical protein